MVAQSFFDKLLKQLIHYRCPLPMHLHPLIISQQLLIYSCSYQWHFCLAKPVMKSSQISNTATQSVPWCLGITSHPVQLSTECFDAGTLDDQNNSQIFKLIGKSVKLCVHMPLLFPNLAPCKLSVCEWGNETGHEASRTGTITGALRWGDTTAAIGVDLSWPGYWLVEQLLLSC